MRFSTAVKYAGIFNAVVCGADMLTSCKQAIFLQVLMSTCSVFFMPRFLNVNSFLSIYIHHTKPQSPANSLSLFTGDWGRHNKPNIWHIMKTQQHASLLILPAHLCPPAHVRSLTGTSGSWLFIQLSISECTLTSVMAEDGKNTFSWLAASLHANMKQWAMWPLIKHVGVNEVMDTTLAPWPLPPPRCFFGLCGGLERGRIPSQPTSKYLLTMAVFLIIIYEKNLMWLWLPSSLVIRVSECRSALLIAREQGWDGVITETCRRCKSQSGQ